MLLHLLVPFLQPTRSQEEAALAAPRPLAAVGWGSWVHGQRCMQVPLCTTPTCAAEFLQLAAVGWGSWVHGQKCMQSAALHDPHLRS